ncbi:MAG: helix-turn-helix transcriptional regulator [Tissierellia bacterium]|nr:helix-turn-helix transcriptional regulator [Tissierellia bacterium]
MNKIKELAKEQDIKISEVIRKTGLSKSYVYDVINGKSTPTIGVAQKISKALNANLTDVFPDTLDQYDK